MAYRLGEAVEYDPFSPERHEGKDFTLGDPVDYDPFEEEEKPGLLERVSGYFKTEEKPDIAEEVAPGEAAPAPAGTGLPEESEFTAAPGPLGEPILKKDLPERPITPFEQAYQEEMAAIEGEEPDEDALEKELRATREAEKTGEAPAEPQIDPKTGRPIIARDTEPWRWENAKRDLKAWSKEREEKEKRHQKNLNEAKKSILRKDPTYQFPEGQGPWVEDPRELHERKRGIDPATGKEIDWDAMAARDMTGEEKKSWFNQFGSRMVPGAYTGIKRFEEGLYTTNYYLWNLSDKQHREGLDNIVDEIAKGAFPDDLQKQEAYKVRFAQEASDLWGSGRLIDDLIMDEAEKHGVMLKADPLDIANWSNPPKDMEKIKKKNIERVMRVKKDIEEFYKKNPQYKLPDDWEKLTAEEQELKYPGIFWGEQISTNAINSLLSIGTYLTVQAASKNATMATLAAGLALYPSFVQEISDELKNLEQTEGIVVPDEVKAELSLLGAVPSSMIEGLSERLGFGPGTMQHFKKLGQKALKRELIKRFVQSALAKKTYTFAGKPTLWTVKQGLSGYAEEAGQQVVSNAAAQFVGSERSLFQGAGEAGRIGFFMEPVLGGPAVATRQIVTAAKERKAKKKKSAAQEQIDRILKEVEGQTAEDILLDDDLAPAAEGPGIEEPVRETEFTGAESVEAEETAAEFTEEELAAAAAAAPEVEAEVVPEEKPAPAPRAPKVTEKPRMGERPTAAVKRIWGVPELVGGKRVAPGRTTEPWKLPAEKRPEELQRVKEIWQGKRAPQRGGIIEDVSLPPAKTRITPTSRRQVMQNYANELGQATGAGIRFDNVVFQDERPIGLQMTITDGPAKGARFTISDRAHKTKAQAQAFVENIVNAYTQAAPAAPVLAPVKKAPAKTQQKEFDDLVASLNDEQRAAVKDLIEWDDMPIDQRLGLMRAELATLEQKKALKAPEKPPTKAAPKKPAAAPPTPPAAPPPAAIPAGPTPEGLPIAPPGERWESDRGAMPGEPSLFLDAVEGDLDTAQAAIIEHQLDDGSLFELVDDSGASLGMFKDAKSAVQAAEERFEAPAPAEKAPAEKPPVLPGGPRVAPRRTTPPAKPGKKAADMPTMEIEPGRQGAIEYVYRMTYEGKQQFPGEDIKNLVALHVWHGHGDDARLLEIRYATRDNYQEVMDQIHREIDGATVTLNFDLTPYSPRKGEISYKEYEAARDEGIERPEMMKAPIPGGEATAIVTPKNAEGYPAHYDLVEADDLIPSHSAETFQKNKEYPEGIQERAYHSDTTEQAKVITNAGKLDARILLSDDPTPTGGPPIVEQNDLVLSGNSRTMSIQRAFKDPQKVAKYKNQLTAAAFKYGLAPKDVKAMKKPVLIRRILVENDEQMRSLAREFNETLTAGMGEAAEIASMGKSIKTATMEKIGIRLADREISLRELLGKKDGLEILNWLVDDGAVSATQKNQYLNKTGDLLNKRGKETIESAIFGNIIDDLDLINSAQKSHLNKIEKSLAELAKVKARGEAWDITPDLKEGLRLATAAQAQDLSVRDLLAQQPLFGEAPEYTQTAIGLADLLIKDKPKQHKDRWTGYSTDAVADTKKQVQMFKPKSQAESLKQYFGIEAGPPAAPAAEVKAPAEPAEVKNYYSGANRLGDMQGHIAAGVPIGVEISELSKNGEALLIQYLKDGGQVFIDSGAFGANIRGELVNWPAVLKNYMRIAKAAGDNAKNLVVVAPDIIGDAFKTINITGKYRRELNRLAERGVGIILPVHRPEVPGKLSDVWANMVGIMDKENRPQAIAGFPSQHKNKQRINPEDYAEIFRAFYPPKRVHLLGISPKAADFADRINELRRLDPNIEIIADANRLRSQAGRILKPEIYAARAAKKANEGQAKPTEEYIDLRPEYETREGFDYTYLPADITEDQVEAIGKDQGLPDEFVSEFLYLVKSGLLGTEINFAIEAGEWRDDTMMPFKEFHDILSLGMEQIAPAMDRADMVRMAVEWEEEKAAERARIEEERKAEAEKKPPMEAPKVKPPGEILGDRIRRGQQSLDTLDQYNKPDLVKAAQTLGIRATGKKGTLIARIQKEAPAIIEAAAAPAEVKTDDIGIERTVGGQERMRLIARHISDQTELGIVVQLWRPTTQGQKTIMRMEDLDAGEQVALRKHPSYQAALFDYLQQRNALIKQEPPLRPDDARTEAVGILAGKMKQAEDKGFEFYFPEDAPREMVEADRTELVGAVSGGYADRLILEKDVIPILPAVTERARGEEQLFVDKVLRGEDFDRDTIGALGKSSAKQIAKALGVSQTGDREALIERILAALPETGGIEVAPAAPAPTAPAKKAAPEHEKRASTATLGAWVADQLGKYKKFNWMDLFKAADRAFEGTQAQGVYTPKDAYDGMELGVNIWMGEQREEINKRSPAKAVEYLKSILQFIPTQTKRTREQGEFQQFSTPPPLAYVANWVANITGNDTYLEPSAGVGGLAVFAKNMVGPPNTIINELDPRRASLLGELGFDTVYTEDASQLDNILPDDVKPTVIVMNPPFSATAGRLKGIKATKYGAKHIEQALNRLEPGGRLVAIVGKGMGDQEPGFKSWWNIIKGKYDVKANVRVSGQEYKKYGTTFDNQLLVIDKIAPTGYDLVRGKVDKIEDLIPKLEAVKNDRQEVSKPGEERKPAPSIAPGAEIPAGVEPGAEQPPAVGAPIPAGRPGERPTAEPTEPPAGETGRAEQLEPAPGEPILEPEIPTGERGETERPGRPAGAGARPGPEREPGGIPPAGPGELSLEDLDSMIDEVIEEETAREEKAAATKKAGEKPAAPPPTGAPTETDDFAEIANIIRNIPKDAPQVKDPAIDYGVREELLYPEAYEQARPFFENSYAKFQQKYPDDPKQWVTTAYRNLRKYNVDPRIIKNWIKHFWDTGRILAPEKPVKTAEIKKAEKKREKITASLYEDYGGAVTGATKHPSPLVETAALADTDFPELTYKVDLPAKVLKPKKAGQGISDIQLEAVVLAGQAHEQELVDGRRKGFFAGHGTGVGKGRIISSIILDNWNKGRKKAIWISEKASLETDAKRDLTSIGWPEGAKALFNLNKTKLGSKVKKRDTGIMFSTYSTLASQFSKIDPKKPETFANLKVRLNQIRDWLGEDFDGIIAFDESHNMANSTAQQGSMGSTQPAQKALAGILLEELFPKARLVYVSATGATEVSNMAYLSRLGMWGEGTAFADQRQFVNSISGAGLAAMEMIARSLKARGLYTAPSLSYDGVNYDRLEHDLTPEQTVTYNKIARMWQIIMQNTDRALNITNGNLSGAQKRAALSKLWGTQQRVFNQIITAMQLPTMLSKMEQDIANGDSIVIQLVNTNDAQTQRAMANRKEGEEIEDLDFTPRASIGEYLKKAFPTQQFETYLDDEGRVRVRPVTDSDGNPVENKEAIAMREEMLKDLRRLDMPDAPLDQLIDAFGVDKVAEMTGRRSRVVTDPRTGTKKEQKWSKSKALKDVDAFNNDKKPILVFSEAGGTGASYHADRTYKNQRMRRHYLLQAGWRADKAIQGLGRTHRSNQAQPPEYFLVTTNLKAQKRFISSIARRLDQLGALTKGQRQAGSQGIFQARDNLESEYARDALHRFYQQLVDGKIEGMTWQEWEEQTGTNIVDPQTGKLYAQTPDIIRTMNRMLSMEIEQQNIAFEGFSRNLDQVIQEHADAGTLDVGIETITGIAVEKASEKIVRKDPETGAETKYVRVKVTNPSNKVPWEDVAGQPIYQNVRSGKVWAGSVERSRTTKSGAIIKYRILRSPGDTTQRQDGATLADEKKWRQLETKPAQEEWNTQFNEIPETTDRIIDMLTGDLLSIWDRLTGFATVYRTETDAGERLLGRVIAPGDVDTILERLGIQAETVEVPNDQIAGKILAGDRATLANGWELKKSLVSGDERIELIGPRGSEIDLLEKQGVIVEQISWKDRMFIPTGKEASKKVFDRILVNRPVVKLITSYKGPRIADTELSEASTEFAQKIKSEIDKGKKITQTDLFEGTAFEKVEPLPEPTQLVSVKSTGTMGFESHVIANAEDAAAFAAPLAELAQEKAFMISTDDEGNIKEVHFMSKGTRSATSVGIVETVGRLFNTPGVTKAYFIHNHPSGITTAESELEPSPEDRNIALGMSELAAAGGVEMENLVISGPLYLHYSARGRMPAIKAKGKIRKTTRKVKVPVVERVIRPTKRKAVIINNSDAAKEHIKNVYGNREGFMLVGAKLQDLGFLEFKPGTPAAQLVRDLIAEGERTNASGFIFHSKGKSAEFPGMPPSRMAFLQEWQKQLGSGALQMFEIIHDGVSYADTGQINQPNYESNLENLLSDDPVFASKRIKPPTPQTVEEVNLMVNAVTAKWAKGGPNIKVYRTQEGLPQVVKDYLKAENREADIITGAYYDNVIYLVAENIGSNEETALTILHEGFGHHGLRGTLGKDVFPVLRDLYIAKRKEVDAIAAELGINTKTVDGQMQAAEEWFANQAQLGIESKWYDRLVRAIKNWIRKLGIRIKISDPEIRALIAAARQFTLTGQKVTAHPGATPAFKKKKYGKRIDWEQNLTPEQAERIKAAKGVGAKTVKQKIGERVSELKAERAHFPALQQIEDKTMRAQMADILRVHQEIPEVAKQKTAEVMRGFIKNLSSDGYDVYSMNIILSDMLRDIDSGLLNNQMLGKGETLPFGFKSVEEVQEAERKFRKLAEIHPEIGEALAERKKYIDNLVRQLVQYKILKKEVLKHKDYYHHQVLKYWGTKDKGKGVATGSADVRKHWRPWMAARKGSLLDYNTEYVEAEFVALSQQLGQLETAKTLQRIKNEADIYADLKDQAKAQNLQNFYKQEAENLSKMFKTTITPAEVMADKELDPLFGYKQAIAMSINALEGMAYKGKLGGDSEWQEIIDGLAMAHEDKKEDREAVFSPIPDGRLFDFLAYLVRTGQPGASWAATIFKNIHGRNNHIKGALGKNFLTYRQLIPEGYVEWKPEPGKTMFWANTLADNVIQQVIAGERDLQDSDVRQTLARGRDIVWVLPKGLAETMDTFKDHPETKAIGRMSEAMLRAWKQYILLNPIRVLKYNINNMSGDLDITLAYNPKIALGMRKSLRDLRAFNKGKADETIKDELETARRLGVIGSGWSVQEVEEITKKMGIDKFTRQIILGEKPSLAVRYWELAKGATNTRENILRLAAFRHFKAEIAKGKSVYGASKVKEIDAIKDPIERAAKLARELVGDYGNISHSGQWIRKRLMPFYSWMEINSPRYVYMLRNVRYEGRDPGMRPLGIASKKALTKTAAYGIKAMGLYALVQIWNNLLFPDEEEEFGAAGRRQLHLILGRRDDGSIMSIRFQGALSDTLSFFGLEDWPDDIKDIVKSDMKGKTVAEKLIDIPKAFATRLFHAIRPEPKLLLETVTGYSTYPDPFSPRPIRDTKEHIARLFSLDSIYRRAVGRPGRGKNMAEHFLADLEKLIVYKSDPGEQAYYDVRNMVFDWKKDKGIEVSYGKPTNRGNALYYYKQALKFGDFKAAERYLVKYYELGGSARGLKQSIKQSHPLAGIKKMDRRKFRLELDPAKQKTLERALKWYDETYRREGSRELRQRARQTYRQNR